MAIGKTAWRRAKALCFLSAIACLVSISAMIVVLSYEESKPDVASGKSKPFMCVRWDELTQNGTIPDSDQLLAKLNKSQNSSQCCVENSKQMSSLLESMLVTSSGEKEILPTHDPRNFSMSKASAHRRLVKSPFSKIKRLTWTTHNHHLDMPSQLLRNEHIKNVDVIPSEMIIILEGFYMVYVSVKFKQHSPEFCKNLKRRNKICTVFVMMRPDADAKAKIILQTESSCCGKTSYKAGIFHLKPDNSIYVELSMHGGVIYDDESTFFGTFMISDVQPNLMPPRSERITSQNNWTVTTA